MSARERRRRPAPPVKVAFGNGDDEASGRQTDKQNKQRTSESNHSIVRNSVVENNINDLSSNKCYERSLFTIHNITVEIILENDIITWSNVADEKETSRRKSASRDTTTHSVNIDNVYAVTPIFSQSNLSSNPETMNGTSFSASGIPNASMYSLSALPQDTTIRGFQLHSFQQMQENILQEMLIIFQSTQPSQIEHWYQLLSKMVADRRQSRHIVVMANPYAGMRRARHTYSAKVKAMLERAHHKITYIEIDDQCTADEAFDNFQGDFDSIDGLVIIGGDGSVINVINALIRYLTKENRTRLDIEHDLPSIPFPLCIVPDGTTNIICHTIHGNADHCTPIFHLLFNQRMKIDMSAIFDIDSNFVTANFSAGAGYPANVLKYFPRYELHETKTIIKKSFAKAASRKNLKPIQAEIRYVPVYQDAGSMLRCFRGCSLCTPAAAEKSDDQVKAFDNFRVEQINRPKNPTPLSNNEQSNRLPSVGKYVTQSSEKEKTWKVLQSDYMQVAVLTNASLWSYAPMGLSKYGHIGNGLLDLILIEPVTRKEFLRYVRRNGNMKDQYELPFTKLIKVKEVEIKLKSSPDVVFDDISGDDNQLDSTISDNPSNESASNEENKPSTLHWREPHPPSTPRPEDSKRHRRRHHRPSEQVIEFSQNVPQPSKTKSISSTHLDNRRQKQPENEIDKSSIDPYGSATSLRRSGIFQALKSKKDKISLPRPSSARASETDDEKQGKKSRKSLARNLKPSGSLLNISSSNNSATVKPDKSSRTPSRDSLSSAPKRSASITSRSPSVDNGKAAHVNDFASNKKRPCMWNLDFSPYNSPLIRIKCFCRYLQVFGVGLEPTNQCTEINYSCFGRLR